MGLTRSGESSEYPMKLLLGVRGRKVGGGGAFVRYVALRGVAQKRRIESSTHRWMSISGRSENSNIHSLKPLLKNIHTIDLVGSYHNTSST